MANIVGMGIDDTNNFVFAWYDDGKVTAGSSKDLSSRRSSRPYKLPPGKTPRDIVGMGIDGTNNFVFAWYRDGTVSAGTSTDLDERRSPRQYRLPAGKTPEDIVGMGIDGKNNHCFAWYRDLTVSAGSSVDLGAKRAPEPYKLAPGKTPSDIVDLSIDGLVFDKSPENVIALVGEVFESEDPRIGLVNAAKKLPDFIRSLVFAWYRDGSVSAGRSTDLAEVRAPYSYKR